MPRSPEAETRSLAKAKKRRAEMVARISACECEWPVRVNRNGSGHDRGCPAHVLWEQHHDGEDDDDG